MHDNFPPAGQDRYAASSRPVGQDRYAAPSRPVGSAGPGRGPGRRPFPGAVPFAGTGPDLERAARRSSRLVGIDLARFVAVVGMMAAHLMPPSGYPGHVAWVSRAVDGNASTLFAVLGGVSVVLASRSALARGEVAAARWATATRGVLVVLLGATLALGPANVVVVLVYFGVTLVCAVPFLRVRPGWLLGWAASLAVVGPVVNVAVRASLDVESEGGGLSWAELADPVVPLRAVVLTGTYPVVTWLVYLLVGMALAKVLLAAREAGTDRRLLARVLAGGAALLAASLVLSPVVYEVAGRAAALEAYPTLTGAQVDLLAAESGWGAPLDPGWWAFFLQAPHTGAPLDVLRGVGVALVVISAMLLLAGSLPGWALRVVEPVRAAGAAPLTVYTLHVLGVGVTGIAIEALVQAGGFTEVPWWYLGPWILAVHVTGALAVGVVLAVLGTRGPLETVVSTASRRTGAWASGLGRRAVRPPGGPTW